MYASVEGSFNSQTEYDFRVVAKSDESCSLPSSASRATTGDWPEPTGLTAGSAIAGSGSRSDEIDLSRNACSGAVHYNVEVQSDSSDGWSVMGSFPPLRVQQSSIRRW